MAVFDADKVQFSVFGQVEGSSLGGAPFCGAGRLPPLVVALDGA